MKNEHPFSNSFSLLSHFHAFVKMFQIKSIHEKLKQIEDKHSELVGRKTSFATRIGFHSTLVKRITESGLPTRRTISTAPHSRVNSKKVKFASKKSSIARPDLENVDEITSFLEDKSRATSLVKCSAVSRKGNNPDKKCNGLCSLENLINPESQKSSKNGQIYPFKDEFLPIGSHFQVFEVLLMSSSVATGFFFL